jgi:hypothetical protein
MKYLTFRNATNACLVAVSLFISAAGAEQADLTKFRTAYPAAVGSRIDNCDLCHGGTAKADEKIFKNSYLKAYKNAGRSLTAFQTIANYDSDWDGYSNKNEINAFYYPGDSGDHYTGDTTRPVITRLGNAIVTVECKQSYVDAGAMASDNVDGNITSRIVTYNPVNTSVPGTYTVTYNVSDTAGNAAIQVTRTVNVVDTTRPVLTLLGAAQIQAECGTPYVDAGATATDACAGNLTSSIQVTGTVNSSVPDLYTLTYNVSDAYGNAALPVTRTVSVMDTARPVITRIGGEEVQAQCGMPYVDAGATASDACAGNLTPSIQVTGSVNIHEPGSYTLSYAVSDSEGNSALPVTRTVTVVDTERPIITRIGTAQIPVTCGNAYTDPGATAADACGGDLTSSIHVTGAVNPSEPGVYVLTYAVTDPHGNSALPVTRTVTVMDTTIPVITRIGASQVLAECGRPYADPGATAVDTCAGDLTDNIVTSGSVKSDEPGYYTLTYTVSDSEGNAAVPVTRTVAVVDTVRPQLLLTGAAQEQIECGAAYLDPGAIATDACGGDLSGSILTDGSVNANLPGIYTLTYTVRDAAGNNALPVTRTVTVADTSPPRIQMTGSNPWVVDCRTTFVDPGATVLDDCDGSILVTSVGGAAVNTADPGTFKIVYSAVDAAGNQAVPVTRTVLVEGPSCDIVPEGQPEGIPEGEGAAEGLLEGEGSSEGGREGEVGMHAADQNGDDRISLSELLRLIQLFNLGGYCCQPGTEDGYGPGLGETHDCTPHSSDYAPQDWRISLTELLRLVQFFNVGGYHYCPTQGTEDGFCPGL